ncbi:MAG: M56 family metallopeptidase [Candidatus Pelethousia sp.]|nr:M56 family metallopeptidase [Candidatus Pelethousia sp.]
MSITASYAAIVIFLLRMLLKKAPKWISYAMWAMVSLRAVLPFSFSSVLSLFGRFGVADAVAANGMIRYISESIGISEAPVLSVPKAFVRFARFL